MENFALPCKSFVVYICIHLYVPHFHNLESTHKILRTRLKRWSFWRTSQEVARLVNYEESGCRFEVQREEHWVHMQPTWLIAVRERLLEFICVTKLA